MNHADRLLLKYAEIRSVLSGGRAQNLIAFTGRRTALVCATRDCTGGPKQTSDGWKCSGCSKLWPMESVDVFKNEFRDGRKLFGRRDPRVTMADIGIALERTRVDVPWPYAAWTLHVLGSPAPEEQEDERRRRGLGLPMDEIPERILKMVDARELAEMPELDVPGLDFYRVRHWIGVARKTFVRMSKPRLRAVVAR